MEKNKLKLELLQKIITCNDAALLKRVEEILLGVSEAGEDYSLGEKTALSEDFNISPEQEEELMRRYEDHLQNKGKSYTWEEVRKNLKDSYGI